jgi:hypothetical protein
VVVAQEGEPIPPRRRVVSQRHHGRLLLKATWPGRRDGFVRRDEQSARYADLSLIAPATAVETLDARPLPEHSTEVGGINPTLA